MATFGKWLIAEREKANLTQAELAARANVSKNYISALEREQKSTYGVVLTPRLEKVDSIAKGLGVSVNEARLAAGYAPKPVERSENEKIDGIFDQLREIIRLRAEEYDDPEQAEKAMLNDLSIAVRIIVEMDKSKKQKKEIDK